MTTISDIQCFIRILLNFMCFPSRYMKNEYIFNDIVVKGHEHHLHFEFLLKMCLLEFDDNGTIYDY